jgi:hypothetical protein
VRPRSRQVARCGDGAAHRAFAEPVVARPVRRRGVRLTRRGRVVLFILLFALAALAVVGVATAVRAADPAGPRETAVVQPGDTLWSFAERHAPSDDPFGVIEEIRTLNGLSDYTVHPGQSLMLPYGE